jgi:hypothetical protein
MGHNQNLNIPTMPPALDMARYSFPEATTRSQLSDVAIDVDVDMALDFCIPRAEPARATVFDIQSWMAAIKMKVALRPQEETVKISGPNTAAIAETICNLFRFQYKSAPFAFSPQNGVTCTITEVHAFLEPYLDISM